MKVFGFLLVFTLFFLISDDAFAENWKISIKPSDEVKKTVFIPHELPIKSGDIVTWVNNDSTTHQIISGVPKHPDYAGEFFASPELKPGERFSKTLNFDGYIGYYYFCQLHPWLQGKIFFEDLENGPNSTLELLSLINANDILELKGKVHSDFGNTSYEIIIFDELNNILYHKHGLFSSDAKVNEQIDISNSLWTHNTNYFAKLIYGLPSESYTLKIDGLPLRQSSTITSWCNDATTNSYSYPGWYKQSICWYENGLVTYDEINDGLEFFSTSLY